MYPQFPQTSTHLCDGLLLLKFDNCVGCSLLEVACIPTQSLFNVNSLKKGTFLSFFQTQVLDVLLSYFDIFWKVGDVQTIAVHFAVGIFACSLWLCHILQWMLDFRHFRSNLHWASKSSAVDFKVRYLHRLPELISSDVRHVPVCPILNRGGAVSVKYRCHSRCCEVPLWLGKPESRLLNFIFA